MKVFNALKKKKEISVGSSSKLGRSTKAKEPRFILEISNKDNRAYLNVTDNNGIPFCPDYRMFTGKKRHLIRAIDSIRKELDFKVDWDTETITSKSIPIGEHDYLLDLIRDTVELYDASGENKIMFSDETLQLKVNIPQVNSEMAKQDTDITPQRDANTIDCKVYLTSMGKMAASILDMRLLSERFVLFNNTIYEIDPIGENFESISLFHTKINTKDLYNYLALLSSSFLNIKLSYGNYGIREGKPVEAGPCLIFEDVDSFQALRLSIGHTVEAFSPDFLNDYEVSRLVEINDFERSLIVRDVIYKDISNEIAFIKRVLTRHKKRLSSRHKREFFQDGALFIIEPDLASSFLYGELEGLLERFTLFGTEKLKSYKIKPVSAPPVSLKLSYGIDFLEGEGTVDIEGEEMSLSQLLLSYRKKGYVKLNDGTNIIIEKGYIKRLERLFNVSKEKVKVSFFDLPLIDDLIDERGSSSSFPKAKEIFLGFNSIESLKVKKPKIKGTLRNYQVYGYKWLYYLHHNGLCGCLADDMGLGKTLQAIALLSSVRKESNAPSLIVMPRTLIFNWEREIERFCPDITTYTWYGQNRDMDEARKKDVILTSYGMLRSNIEIFKEERFFYVILDESQHIKNINSQISKAVTILNCEHRLALSGTPIENNLWEIFSLFRFLNPAMFPSQQAFLKDYIDPIQNRNDETAIKELRKKIYPFVLRRIKEDVLSDLPPKIEQVLYVDMTDEQKKLYNERRTFYKEAIREQVARQGIEKSHFFIFQALSELRQIASIPEAKTEGEIISPKRELLIEHIEDAVSNNRKVLVFVNFLSAIESLSRDLEDNGIQFLSMTGATRDRGKLVDAFQNDPNIKVFLMTLKTGGIGLNLTAADTIFIYDPWWNLAAENQAIDRTHRIGQTKKVHCYRLICRESIEEKIVELQKKKQELFDSIISKDQGTIKRLSMEDIDYILT